MHPAIAIWTDRLAIIPSCIIFVYFRPDMFTMPIIKSIFIGLYESFLHRKYSRKLRKKMIQFLRSEIYAMFEARVLEQHYNGLGRWGRYG